MTNLPTRIRKNIRGADRRILFKNKIAMTKNKIGIIKEGQLIETKKNMKICLTSLVTTMIIDSNTETGIGTILKNCNNTSIWISKTTGIKIFSTSSNKLFYIVRGSSDLEEVIECNPLNIRNKIVNILLLR